MTLQQLGTLVTILIWITGIISAGFIIRAYKKNLGVQRVIIPYGIASMIHGLLVTIHSLCVGPIPLVSFIIPVINTIILFHIVTKEDYKGFK